MGISLKTRKVLLEDRNRTSGRWTPDEAGVSNIRYCYIFLASCHVYAR